MHGSGVPDTAIVVRSESVRQRPAVATLIYSSDDGWFSTHSAKLPHRSYNTKQLTSIEPCSFGKNDSVHVVSPAFRGQMQAHALIGLE